MRLTPWILPLALSAALLTTTSYVFADNHEDEDQQHEPLDDAALEEEYGIKAGSVKRDPVENSDSDSESDSEQPSDEEDRSEDEQDEASEEPADDEARSSADESAADVTENERKEMAGEENNGEITADGDEVAEGGTGGTGSAEDALANGEDDESTEDDGESDESTDDNE
ncbi:hypothetical protein LCGC14_0453500 [marine sediment metagenome]|uniref:Uncharacterized protein n=1 Tax=marine sediment metagenome TaxID=412755 RepID=A0A0F9SH24_9ZZZZ|nr:hypothetical protein [Halomonas sp.]HDZ46594.1 hypothetical protein [Halomonas sp.]HEB07083.1 hypothetical protein [Halomonas sp.]